MEERNLLGQRIKAARIKAGLTQKQLGEQCGMADSAIRKYESGKVKPKLNNLMKLAAVLGYEELDIHFHFPEESLTPFEERQGALLSAFYALNDEGQGVAVERVKELSMIEKYQFKLSRKKPDGDPQI